MYLNDNKIDIYNLYENNQNLLCWYYVKFDETEIMPYNMPREHTE